MDQQRSLSMVLVNMWWTVHRRRTRTAGLPDLSRGIEPQVAMFFARPHTQNAAGYLLPRFEV